MSEREKEILETIGEALPEMSERDKGYFLGYAEAMLNSGKSRTSTADDHVNKDPEQEVG